MEDRDGRPTTWDKMMVILTVAWWSVKLSVDEQDRGLRCANREASARHDVKKLDG